jgi:hypothetical protein
MTALPLADGGGIDQAVSAGLFVAATALGFVAERRLRRRAFASLPVPAAWVCGGLAAASVFLALWLPLVLRPTPRALRPTSTARLQILQPADGEVFHGTSQDPAPVAVSLRLVGGRIVTTTSTNLRPDQGHIHLFLNGALVSMTYGLHQHFSLVPGAYRLQAEFVATDHGPFSPRVVATIRFTVVSP